MTGVTSHLSACTTDLALSLPEQRAVGSIVGADCSASSQQSHLAQALK